MTHTTVRRWLGVLALVAPWAGVRAELINPDAERLFAVIAGGFN